MSSQQSNNFNNSNKKFDQYDPRDRSSRYQPQTGNRIQVQTNTMLTSNLDLYIPRVAPGTTEEQVKALFSQSRIATVEYCDFATTKDKDTKKPQYTSAFIKLSSWSDKSVACEDFAKNKSIRLNVSQSSNEFWIILPNNNPLARSHVNTSQLAAATDKLFSQTEQITEKADKFEDEMRATITEMRQMMVLQQEKIEALEFRLTLKASISFAERNHRLIEEEAKDDADLEDVLVENFVNQGSIPTMPRQLSVFQPRNETEYEVAALFTMSTPQMTRQSSVSVVYNEDDECIFSNKQKQRRSPPILTQPQSHVQVGSGKSQSLGEIVAENPDRAIGSRDLCGNL
jgi:hypothetical protein